MPIDSNIRNLIKNQGYIKLDQLMREVLLANPSSYYQTQNSFGIDGDFIISPEISQLLGEIIGFWSIRQWEEMGRCKKINLVGLGPGRGLLMHDLLKVAKLVPEFYNALNINLIEINNNFILQQKSNLAKYDLDIKFMQKIENIDPLPSIIIANEFFDALPITQYIKVKDLWYESILIIDPKDGKVKFDKIACKNELQQYLLQNNLNAHDGAIIEESFESLELVRFISDHIKQYSGSALIIDYGYDIYITERLRHNYNPTIQAIKNHRYHPLLETLGEADLSAQVDFAALKNAVYDRGIKEYRFDSQRDFLIENGILLRADVLKQKLSVQEFAIIFRQLEYLLSSDKMGDLFKVFSFSCFNSMKY